MQQRQRPHSNLRSKPHQLDLFAPPAFRGATPLPDWQMLPAATRQALTALIARLILNHMHGARLAVKDEVGCDH